MSPSRPLGIWALFLLALAGPGRALAAADATPAGGIASHVRELDGDTFDATVGKARPAVVLFYAPWCGHSRRAMKDYAIVAATFTTVEQKDGPAEEENAGSTSASPSSSLIVARVDTDKYTHFATRFGITGYPTIKFFPAGSAATDTAATDNEKTDAGRQQRVPPDPDTPAARIAAAVEHSKRAAARARARRAEANGASPTSTGLGIRYKGGVDAKSIVSFLNQQLGTSHRVTPPRSWVRHLQPRTFEPIAMDPGKHVLVFFHAPWCSECSRFAPAWETVAKTFRSDADTVVLASVNADRHRDLAQSHDVSKYPMIKYYPAIEAALRMEAAESKALAAAKKKTKGTGKDSDSVGEEAGVLDAFDVREDGSSSVISLEALQDEEEITSAALEALRTNEASAEFSVADLHARTYNGGMSSQALVDFINGIAGLDRIVGGGIHREAGRVVALDAKAVAFMVALRAGNGDQAVVVLTETRAAMTASCTGGSRRHVDGGGLGAEDTRDQPPTFYERVDGAAATTNGEDEDKGAHEDTAAVSVYAGTKQCVNAKLYLEIMERVLRPDSGIMWVSKEMRRVGALIKDTSNVNHAQQTKLLLRRNVLEAFAGK